MIKIRTPIWKTKSVGLAEDKLTSGVNEVKILYKTKDGERLYPNTFKIAKKDAMTFPVQYVKGVRLRIIPIFSLIEHTVLWGG